MKRLFIYRRWLVNLLIFLVVVASSILLPGQALAVEVTLFGPLQLARETGKPNVFTGNFPGIPGEGLLYIDNGDAQGNNRISSALLSLNGQQVLGTHHFSQKVASIKVPVGLLENNSISITVRSKPGSYLTIWIKTEVAVELTAGMGGAGHESPDKLLIALPIENKGAITAQNVQVTSAELASASLLSPVFPEALGDIASDRDAVFDASFTSDSLDPGSQYLLTVGGTYEVGAVAIDFTVSRNVTVPQKAPGSALLSLTSATPISVSGAPFPPEPLLIETLGGFNEEKRPPIPAGQLRGDLQPSPLLSMFAPLTPLTTVFDRQINTRTKVLSSSDDPVVFVQSSQFGTYNGTWLDPNGATSNDVVIGSFNGPVAFSSDGGINFWTLNPTAVFPNNDASGNLIDGGFCCDQVIMYIPKIDRFVWLMQFRRGMLPGDDPNDKKTWSGPNRYRLAVASPQQIIDSGGTAWTYWDLTSGLFGFGNKWMDYPDLAVGDNFLYFSADVVEGGGLFVGRIPLSDIQSGGVINIGFTDPALGSMAWGSHLVQNVRDAAYWAGHNSTSQMRIFSLPENSDYYSWVDVNIDSWPNEDYSSFAPNGENWLGFGFPKSAIIGSTRLSRTHFVDNFVVESDELWLSWSAARGGGFLQPHIQLVIIDTFDYSTVSQRQIWNSDVAIAYPALAVNSRSEVGVALAFGGGNTHSNFAVGIYGDPVFFYPALGDASVGRFGDYFGVRRHWSNEGLFSAFGMRYTLNAPAVSTVCRSCSLDGSTKCSSDDDCLPSKGVCTSQCSTNLHYILFGRESAVDPEPPPIPK